MPLIAGLAAAALTSLGLSLPGIELLRRRGYRLLALGLSTGTAGLVLVPVAGVMTLAIGTAVGSVLLVAGALRLPGAARAPRLMVRQVLDGGLGAACVLYVGWGLVIEPAGRGYLARDPLAWSYLLALGVLVVVLVLLWRADQPRRPLLLAGTALAGVLATGLALTAALAAQNPPLVVAGGAAFGAAQLGLGLAARRLDPAARRWPAPPGHGLVVTWVPVSVVVLTALIRLATVHYIDNTSALVASFIGLTLCARQASALRAVHGYVDRLTREQALFSELAHTDALTGLGNRRELMRTVPRSEYSLIAIDLDGFKSINDVRGHEVGDAVLVEVASRIRSRLRPGDLALRLGGDEFAVLMWTGTRYAERIGEQLRGLIARPYLVDGSTLYLSASVGLASGDAAEDIVRVLRNADVALRFAKQQGKNRVERYDAGYARWLHRRTRLEQELPGALARGELSLVYQPVMALPEGRAVGAEALLRWRHPDLGAVPPREFIPVAEECGLITRLDRWVLHEACHRLAGWLADGYDVWLSVNISVRELHQPSYVPEVIEAVRTHRLPAGRLVLEVTEHALAVGCGRAETPSSGRAGGERELVERLAALRAAGVRVALDDFGAGYSSLSQLRRLPADILKIDRSLVVEPPLMVDALVRLGRRLGLDVIAEGVAEATQRAALESVGCPLGQGELFCRPLPAERVEALFPHAATHPVQYLGQVDSAHEMRQS